MIEFDGDKIREAMEKGTAFECKYHCVNSIRVGERALYIDGWKYLTYERRDGKLCMGVNLSFNMVDTAAARFDVVSLFFPPDVVKTIAAEVEKAKNEYALGTAVLYIPLLPEQQTIDDLWGEL